METDTVILSAKWTGHTIPVPPGKYNGFGSFRKGRCTSEQAKYICECGVFILRNEQGHAIVRIPMGLVPVNNATPELVVINTVNMKYWRLSVGEGWQINLGFLDAPPLKWSNFPGEVEIGFTFAEG
jgi:hypothetical protein